MFKKLFLVLSLATAVGLQAVVMHRNRARSQTVIALRVIDPDFPHTFIMPNGDVHLYDPESGLVSPIVYNSTGFVQRIDGVDPAIITHRQWAIYNQPYNQRYNNVVEQPEPLLDIED